MTSEERHCLVNGEPTQGEPDKRGNYCGCDACVLAYAERTRGIMEQSNPAQSTSED